MILENSYSYASSCSKNLVFIMDYRGCTLPNSGYKFFNLNNTQPRKGCLSITTTYSILTLITILYKKPLSLRLTCLHLDPHNYHRPLITVLKVSRFLITTVPIFPQVSPSPPQPSPQPQSLTASQAAAIAAAFPKASLICRPNSHPFEVSCLFLFQPA